MFQLQTDLSKLYHDLFLIVEILSEIYSSVCLCVILSGVYSPSWCSASIKEHSCSCSPQLQSISQLVHFLNQFHSSNINGNMKIFSISLNPDVKNNSPGLWFEIVLLCFIGSYLSDHQSKIRGKLIH